MAVSPPSSPPRPSPPAPPYLLLCFSSENGRPSRDLKQIRHIKFQ